MRRGHPRYFELLNELADVHERKNAGYAKESDPLSNFKMCEEFGVPAWKGALVRLSDKYSRVVQLAKDAANDKVGESISTRSLTLLAIRSLYGCYWRRG